MNVSVDQLRKLEQDAKHVLSELTSHHAPVVAEFAGSPKAGKSTTIDILTHFFKRVGYKVWAPTEGASKRTPYHLKSDLVAFNTWTLNSAISELLVAYNNVDHHHLIFLDRGPFDSMAWMRVLQKESKHELTEDELEVHRAYAMHPRWSDLITRIYLFDCEPAVSLQREHESKLISLPGTAMNEPMLRALLHQYEHLASDLVNYPLHTVTTSDETTPLSTSYELAVDLMRELRKRVGE
jgi:predicted ATPase